MKNQKHHLTRRTVLRGLGTAMALPALDIMMPSPALGADASNKQPATTPLRIAFVFFPNGAYMPDWTPKETGDKFELPFILEPMARLKDDLTVLSGLAHDNGRAKGDGPGDHARCAAPFLTGAHPYKTAGKDIRLGMSVDQVAAGKIGHKTRFPSLEVGLDQSRDVGNCDSGYSCAYSSNISWRSETTPMPKEVSPQALFDRLFGNGNKSEAARGSGKRKSYDKSILDFVADDAKRLKQKLGRGDQRKLDEYFSSVREIERRVNHKAGESAIGMERPGATPRAMDTHAELMGDLLALAFQTDQTRIATFMLARAGNNRSYPQVGVSGGHHTLSHHGGNKDKIASIRKIDRFHVQQFAYLVSRLKNISEGDGTLLDHCLLLYGSGLSDGNRHRHNDLPVLLAGKAAGHLKSGRHIRYDQDTPLANLFLNILDWAGAPTDEIGDSTGRLKGLDV